MFADQEQRNAPVVVDLIVGKIMTTHPDNRLPLVYLMDSILKNVGRAVSPPAKPSLRFRSLQCSHRFVFSIPTSCFPWQYVALFEAYLERVFMSTYDYCNSQIRQSLSKLLGTWDVHRPPLFAQTLRCVLAAFWSFRSVDVGVFGLVSHPRVTDRRCPWMDLAQGSHPNAGRQGPRDSARSR